MSDAFESEVMDDLFYDSAEGPARPRYGDEFEELDELEDEFEGFEDEFEEYDALGWGPSTPWKTPWPMPSMQRTLTNFFAE